MLALAKSRLNEFLTILKRAEPTRQIIVPAEERGATKYFYFPSALPLFLGHLPYYSPKKFFLPPREPLVRFKLSKGKFSAATEAVQCNQILFGIRHCDVHALKILDKFFADDPTDSYWERRKNTSLIALNCVEPAPSCFCDGMGTRNSKGADVEFTDAGREWRIEAVTKKGRKILGEAASVLHDAGKRAKPLPEKPCEVRATKRTASAITEKEEFWKQISDGCLNCTACNIVCPTCTCFDVEDETDLYGTEGSRYRTWTSCVLDDYSRVAGGFVFRKDERAKSLIRVQHKLNWFKQKFGEHSCTGCGRCSLHCPTKVATADVARKWLQ
ncbi:MAG: 4Fe-4S dicluster domain-containing protein [Candidatus Micrarchaeota archaeon]